VVKSVALFRLLTAQSQPLAIAFGPSDSLRALGSVGGGEARRVRTIDRLRDVVADAADQIRNGCRYREAPGWVIVSHDHLDAVDANGVLSAAFGDLQVPIDRTSGAFGDPILSGNGVLSPSKNRTVSAITYLRGNEEPVSVVNPWAYRPIPVVLLLGRTYHVPDDGRALVSSEQASC
jgi:hypothetical protein